jgi:hypothetical protein
MSIRMLSSLALLGVTLATAFSPFGASPIAAVEAKSTRLAANGRPAEGVLFERNIGQTDAQVRFLARAPGFSLFLTDDEAVWRLHGEGDADAVLRMQLVGGQARAAEGLGEQVTRHTYFDLHRGATHAQALPTYAAARLHEVWPGVDLVYYGRDGALEYDFELAPGVDPAVLALRFVGGRPALTDDGSLQLHGAAEDLHVKPPLAYQLVDGARRVIDSRYVLRDGVVGFELGEFDRDKPLVIDPVFVYASYLGGSGYDRSYDVAVNAAGEAYVTGFTESMDFPLVNALDSGFSGNSEVFVTKFSADGSTVLFSTYLGTPGSDTGQGIALDPAGNMYVTGSTDNGTPGAQDLVELKLNATATALVYAHIVPASDWDAGMDIIADTSGNAFVVGNTQSSDFPQVVGFGPYDPGEMGFLRKIASDGTVLFSGYLGQAGAETFARAVALDGDGDVYVVGSSGPSLLDTDAFLIKLGGALNLIYARTFGGSAADRGLAVAVNAAGSAWIGGDTASADLPSATGFSTSLNGISDGFIARYNDAGTLLRSTYFGGPKGDVVSDLALAADGKLVATGRTDNDGIVSKSTTFRTHADLSALLGQAAYPDTWAVGAGVALDTAGNAYVASYSHKAMPTTAGAFQAIRPDGVNGQNGHLAKISWANTTVSITDHAEAEGDSGTQSMTPFVSVGANNAGLVQVNYTTTAGTATSGTDFIATSGTLTITGGDNGAPIAVDVIGDTVDEPDETFTIDLSAPVNAGLADAQSLITIVDDDLPLPSLSINDASVIEGTGVGATMNFTLSLSAASAEQIEVDWTSADGSAVAPGDYAADAGRLAFTPGELTHTLAFALVGDALPEPDESFVVTLSNPLNANLGDAIGSGTILDDDLDECIFCDGFEH